MVEGISVAITSSEAGVEGDSDMIREPRSFSTADIFFVYLGRRLGASKLKRKAAKGNSLLFKLCERYVGFYF